MGIFETKKTPSSAKQADTQENAYSKHVCESLPTDISRLSFPEKSKQTRAHLIIQLSNELDSYNNKEWTELNDFNPDNGRTGIHASERALKELNPSLGNKMRHANTLLKLKNAEKTILQTVDRIQQRINNSEKLSGTEIRVIDTDKRQIMYDDFSLDITESKKGVKEIESKLHSDLDQLEKNLKMAEEHNCKEILPPRSPGFKIVSY